jgi:hypothetical protein
MLSNFNFQHVKIFRFGFLEIKCFSEYDWEPLLLLDTGSKREMRGDKIPTITRDLTYSTNADDSDDFGQSTKDQQSGKTD